MKATKWIGVDIHKKQITICIINDNGVKDQLVFERTPEGIAKFIPYINNNTIIGVESTTWTRDFAIKCVPFAQDVIIFNTIELKKLMDRTKKTDKIDAAKIALILQRFEKDELSICAIKSDEFAEVKGLLNVREKIVRRKTETKNEIIAMLDYWGESRSEKFFIKLEADKKWIADKVKIPATIRTAILGLIETIEIYEKQIKDLGNDIENKLKDNAGYCALTEKIKGVGKTTGAYIISKIEDVNRFENHKKLVSYFGLAPKVSLSDGKGFNGHITKNTDKGLLRVLIQASWISVKYDKSMKAFYDNLRARSCKQKAIVAVARKIVVNAFYILKQVETCKKTGIYT